MTHSSTPMTHSSTTVEWTLPDENATEQFAKHLAQAMPTLAIPLIVYLSGDLGTGKTTITRGVLRALGEAGQVRSPTYGLQSEYFTAGGRVVHMDLYRLNVPEELQALAIADQLPDSQLWLIEWPERGTDRYLPPADLQLDITVEGSGRAVLLQARSAAGTLWIQQLSRDSS
jgi:tRNA threonylcarbamoyladenosine biosynthesis protein TsaE